MHVMGGKFCLGNKESLFAEFERTTQGPGTRVLVPANIKLVGAGPWGKPCEWGLLRAFLRNQLKENRELVIKPPTEKMQTPGKLASRQHRSPSTKAPRKRYALTNEHGYASTQSRKTVGGVSPTSPPPKGVPSASDSLGRETEVQKQLTLRNRQSRAAVPLPRCQGTLAYNRQHAKLQFGGGGTSLVVDGMLQHLRDEKRSDPASPT